LAPAGSAVPEAFRRMISRAVVTAGCRPAPPAWAAAQGRDRGGRHVDAGPDGVVDVDRYRLFAAWSLVVVGPADGGDVHGDSRARPVALTEPGPSPVVNSGGGRQEVRFAGGPYLDWTLLGVVDADWGGHAEVFRSLVCVRDLWLVSAIDLADTVVGRGCE
jgi:hypothetical protein